MRKSRKADKRFKGNWRKMCKSSSQRDKCPVKNIQCQLEVAKNLFICLKEFLDLFTVSLYLLNMKTKAFVIKYTRAWVALLPVSTLRKDDCPKHPCNNKSCNWSPVLLMTFGVSVFEDSAPGYTQWSWVHWFLIISILPSLLFFCLLLILHSTLLSTIYCSIISSRGWCCGRGVVGRVSESHNHHINNESHGDLFVKGVTCSAVSDIFQLINLLLPPATLLF